MAAYYKKVLIPLALFMAVILFAAPFVAMTNRGIHREGFASATQGGPPWWFWIIVAIGALTVATLVAGST